jgi:hypothetical protein
MMSLVHARLREATCAENLRFAEDARKLSISSLIDIALVNPADEN